MPVPVSIDGFATPARYGHFSRPNATARRSSESVQSIAADGRDVSWKCELEIRVPLQSIGDVYQ